ncbi:MAG: hypothetical protein J6B11_10870 [Spirochaetales bacterium]|nr:hypothetical protein [Spirochaetales bacterium]
MTITKICLIIMIFLLTTKRCLAKSANSQQPTANSQQPTANSQQPTANSQQPTANSQQPTSVLNKNNIQYFNNVFNETERFRIFSDRSFFMPFWQFVMLNLFQHPDSETSSQ